MAVPASQPMTNTCESHHRRDPGIADCIRISGHRDDPCPGIRTSMLRIEAGSGPLSADRTSRSVWRHALVGQFLDRLPVLRQMGKPHAPQHGGRLRELDALVSDDLDAIAARVEEIEERARQQRDACRDKGIADGVPVIDDQAEMTAVVGRLPASLLERHELIAQIHECRGVRPAAELEVEQSAIEGQGLVEVTDLDGDVIHTDGTCLPCFRHGSLSDRPVCVAGLVMPRCDAVASSPTSCFGRFRGPRRPR